MYVRSKDQAPALHNDVTKTLINTIVLNSEAYMEIDDLTCQYVPTGCAVEVSMLNFLEFLGTPDIRNLLIMKARNTELVANIPFCPTRKIMTVAFKITQNGEETVRVVTKGAAEEVLNMCN
jgi:magnesium-transporting ATPase (P-type)